MPVRRWLTSPGAWAAWALVWLAAGAYLCLPRGADSTARALRLVALDTSGSVARIRRNLAATYGQRLVAEARAARLSDQDLAVVRMGASVRVLLAPTRARDLPDEPLDAAWNLLGPEQEIRGGPLDGTDWSGLFRLARDLYGAHPGGEVRVYSDGVDPLGLGWKGLYGLLGDGVEVQLLDPGPVNGQDLALVEMRVADKVPEGMPIGVEVDLAWRGTEPDPGDRPRLRLDLDGQVKELELDVPATATGQGWTRFGVRTQLPAPPPGWYSLTARALVGGDRTPENDRGSAPIQVGEVPLVLVLGDGDWVGAAADRAGFDVCKVDRAGCVEWLHRAHMLWTEGRSILELPGQEIEAFVRSGGTWLFQGEGELVPGWGSVPPIGVHNLAPMLPLEVAFPEDGARDILLVVDGSGSMRGAGWEHVRGATEALMDSMPARDGLALHLFTQKLRPAALEFEGCEEITAQVQMERHRARRELLRTQIPGGKTNIEGSLLQLVDLRRAQDAERKGLVVLVSDGWQDDTMRRPDRKVREELAAVGLELRVIASGESPNMRLLNGLVSQEEHVVKADDLEGMEKLLRDQVLGQVVRRGQDLGVVRARGPEGMAQELAALPLPDGATVSAYLSTRAVEGQESSVVWRSTQGDPVLALAQRGLGMVLCLPTSKGADFLREQPGVLLDWVGFGARRGLAKEPPGAELEWDGENVQLLGAPQGTPWELWALVDGEWVPLATEPLDVRFGLDPRTNLRVQDVDRVERAQLRFPGVDRPVRELAWPRKGHPEFLPGGRPWPQSQPAIVSPRVPAGRGTHPMGPWALGLALVGLVGLILVRGQNPG